MSCWKKFSISNIRHKLRSGEATFGLWMQFDNPSIAEIFGASMFDWVVLDREHGEFSLDSLVDSIRALDIYKKVSLVRVRDDSSREIKGALEAGALGLIVPKVESGEQVRSLREIACLPPTGSRGVGYCRANRFGSEFDDYIEFAQRPLLIGMIETEEALCQIDEILLSGVLDSLLIGPYDLSASLGIVGDFENPKFRKVIDLIRSKCAAANVACGIHAIKPSVEHAAQLVADGYLFIPYSLDSVFLRTAVGAAQTSFFK